MSACTLDTDVVIAALDRADAHHRRAADAITGMLAAGDELLICTVNYAEALVGPAADPRTLEAAVDAIATLGIAPLAPSATLAREAARHRSLGVSLADGFALATARARGSSLASFDRRVTRAASELGVELALE